MAPHSSTLPGKPHGRRSLGDCSPWDPKESDTTGQLHFHFHKPGQKQCIEQDSVSSLPRAPPNSHEDMWTNF